MRLIQEFINSTAIILAIIFMGLLMMDRHSEKTYLIFFICGLLYLISNFLMIINRK